MRKTLFILFLLFSAMVFSQEDIVIAVLEIVDRENAIMLGKKNLLRHDLIFGINKIKGYRGVERGDIDMMMKEHEFQRSGLISSEQRKEIGRLLSAQYVLVAEISRYDAKNIVLTAKLLDIETGEIFKASPAEVVSDVQGNQDKVKEACINVGKALLLDIIPERNGSPTSNSSNASYGSSSRPSYRQNFTESAYGIKMQMIWVEGGSFLMGCTSEQGNDCLGSEKNVRRVTLDGFYIGMLEVTQSQWEKVMGTSIYQQKSKAGANNTGVGSDYPMYCVSWNEAMDFCRELSRLTGKTYTLPTEAQWEYAARGGSRNEGTKYAGSNMLDAVGWYTKNSGSSTHRCGTKRANGLGIYDMSGNVWEWCKDWYSSSYTSYDTNNPSGPSSGSSRVRRGGSWYNSARDCRVAIRNSLWPSYRGDHLGFRVVCLP